jgi:hypothetical protein
MLDFGEEIKMKNALILLAFLAFLSASVWAAQEQTTAPAPAPKAGTTHPKPAA